MQCVVCHGIQFGKLVRRAGGRVGKCLTCGLVQIVPMPNEAEISKLYHEDMEHFTPYIDQIPVHRVYFKKKVQELHTHGKLLDIGCAMGILLEEAQKAGLKAQGIDISHDAVAYCRRNKLDVSEGTITSAAKKFQENSFDAVTAFEIIEHERNPLGLMRRVYKLLKNGGITVLTTPNHSGNWRKLMGRWWVGYNHPEHVTFWDPESLSFLLKKAGFTHVDIRRDSPRPFPLSFVFTRGADYITWAAWVLKPMGRFFDQFNLVNPVNPWDDLIVTGRK